MRLSDRALVRKVLKAESRLQYGNQLVPLASTEEKNLQYNCHEKSFQVLGSVPLDAVPCHLFFKVSPKIFAICLLEPVDAVELACHSATAVRGPSSVTFLNTLPVSDVHCAALSATSRCMTNAFHFSQQFASCSTGINYCQDPLLSADIYWAMCLDIKISQEPLQTGLCKKQFMPQIAGHLAQCAC